MATRTPSNLSNLINADWWSALALPSALAVVQVAGTYFSSQGQTERASLDALGVLLLVLGPICLIPRERHPLAALWAVISATLAYLLLNYAFGPVFLSVIVALYAAVQLNHRIAAVSAAVVLFAGHFGARYVLRGEAPSLAQLAIVGAWLLAVLAMAEVLRMRRASALETQRVRDEEAQRRRSEERLSIARELHDVLAHHISLINVQAGVALHLMDRRPEQAQTALTAIEGASREALAELRSVLDILHRPEETAPRGPVPGLARLTGLVSQAEAAGLNVRTQIKGAPRPLPAPVDAAAFRIIQEALTNVIRHAGASTATVHLSYTEETLGIEVDDDGGGGPQAGGLGSGKGISGMGERVAALGGSFEARLVSGQGFRVQATLPLDASL